MHDLNTLSTWVAIRNQSDPVTPSRPAGAFRLLPADVTLRACALRWLIGVRAKTSSLEARRGLARFGHVKDIWP